MQVRNFVHNPQQLTKQGNFRFYTMLAMVFLTLLLVSNITVQKVISVGPFIITAADPIYPLTYIVCDLLTEVYGYTYSRRVIWIGFACSILMVLLFELALKVPSIDNWPYQQQFELVLGKTPQVVIASLVAFFIGEFINAYTMAKMKLLTKGKYLWGRAISSTVIGQLFDTSVFTVIAFYRRISFHDTLVLMGSVYMLKVGYEIILLPIIYKLAHFLKSREGVDIYDQGTNFNPFLWRIEGKP